MAQAIWNGKVLADSDQTIIVEGNHYFPPHAVDPAVLQPSQTHTVCGWKGAAGDYDVVVDGRVNRDAAWFYPAPNAAAANLAGYVAFWHGVQVKA